MKKLIAILMALMLGMTLALTAVNAEEYDKVDPEARALFDSKWVSEDAQMDIAPQDGELKIQIRKTTEFPNALCWEYTGEFDAAEKSLKAVRNAVKFAIRYTDGGPYDIVETLYEEPADASFTFDSYGRLLWHDGKEDAGQGIEFQKIGRFDDTCWVCERASIEFYWEEEGYKVLVQWASSAWENTEWEYSCYYDAENNTLTSLPFGQRTDVVYNDDGTVATWKEVYNDGEATFRLNEDGRLIWDDAKEDAGHGMLFEEIDISDLNG